LLLANVLVFLWQVNGTELRTIASFAVVPVELLRVGVLGGPAFGPLDGIPVPERYTLLSYMFFHGDLLHLASNMAFLWVFGDNVEDAMGHLRYLLFYLLCGILAALAHTVMLPLSRAPLIGASGAVSGVIAAYLMLHPRVMVWVLAFRVIPLKLSAGLALGAWVVSQFIMLLVPNSGPVAWWGHVGGLVAGALLILVMRRQGVRLFDRGLAVAGSGRN
jgi:membrane associated rhomboid family serine protease